MSYSESIKICKGGRLQTNNLAQNIDLTDQLYDNLFSFCDIEDGVTLKDIFILVEKWCHVLSPITTSSSEWMHEIVREGLDNKFEEMQCIEHLEIAWAADMCDDKLYESISFHGIGPNAEVQNEKCSYAIELDPTHKLINYPVKLNKEFKVTKFDSNEINVVFKATKEFTLIDIIKGIFWELSFFGSPKSRDKQNGELSKALDELRIK